MALILLLVNGVGAILGGWGFIRDPISGGAMQMPLENLEHSPFKDYLIPGIILFVFNGLFSLGIFILTLVKYKRYPALLIFQGYILSIWIIVQLIMIRSFHYLHAIFGGIGVILIILGLLLWERRTTFEQKRQFH